MRIFATYMMLFTVLVSCEKLEEVTQPPSASELQGKWELQKASCFCFFADDFNFAAHTLQFNSATSQLTIENSEDTFFITDAGTYSVIIENNRITINDGLVYTYKIEDDVLTLNFIDNPQIADDEISLIYFKR